MQKNIKLNIWFWRWHVIAGIVCLPFLILFTITGGIYLFKDKVDTEQTQVYRKINIPENSTRLSYQEQWEYLKNNTSDIPTSLIIPTHKDEAVEFTTGKFSNKRSFFINPYTLEILGEFSPKETWMYKVRKLHGELLLKTPGTLVVELIASWMVMLIITGLYMYWPKKLTDFKRLFSFKDLKNKKRRWAGVHKNLGFYFSLLLLLTLAGAFPWTNIVGHNYKKIQELTHSGYPKEWFFYRNPNTQKGNSSLSLDAMVNVAKQETLSGKISLQLPKRGSGTFSIKNGGFPLTQRQKIYFDQFTGEKLKTLEWENIGGMMRVRQWLMAFHQGQFGTWNFILMLVISVALFFISISALVMSLKKLNNNKWVLPNMPNNFKVSRGLLGLILVMSIVFPLFGLSLLTIYIKVQWKGRKRRIAMI